MKKTGALLALALAVMAGFPGCASAPVADQIRFGVWASQNNLWDEAIFRWKKAIEDDPKSAAARNNLAVAYEKKGLYEEALKEYEEALRLQPNNSYIKSNYENCRDFITPADEKKK